MNKREYESFKKKLAKWQDLTEELGVLPDRGEFFLNGRYAADQMAWWDYEDAKKKYEEN